MKQDPKNNEKPEGIPNSEIWYLPRILLAYLAVLPQSVSMLKQKWSKM